MLDYISPFQVIICAKLKNKNNFIEEEIRQLFIN